MGIFILFLNNSIKNLIFLKYTIFLITLIIYLLNHDNKIGIKKLNNHKIDVKTNNKKLNN